MNTHRTICLVAALLVTAGQALVFAVDTAATARIAGVRHDHAITEDGKSADGNVLSAADPALRYPGWRGA